MSSTLLEKINKHVGYHALLASPPAAAVAAAVLLIRQCNDSFVGSLIGHNLLTFLTVIRLFCGHDSWINFLQEALTDLNSDSGLWSVSSVIVSFFKSHRMQTLNRLHYIIIILITSKFCITPMGPNRARKVNWNEDLIFEPWCCTHYGVYWILMHIWKIPILCSLPT